MRRSVSKPHLAQPVCSDPPEPLWYRTTAAAAAAKGPGSACRTGMVTAAAAMAASALSNTRATSVWLGHGYGDSAAATDTARASALASGLDGCTHRCFVVASLLPFLTFHARELPHDICIARHVHTFTLPRSHFHAALARHAVLRRHGAMPDDELPSGIDGSKSSCPPRSMAQTSEIDGSNLRD